MLHQARSAIIKPPRGTLIDRTHPLARGLAGFWAFNEMTGAQVFDLSGNGNHGALTDMDTVNDWTRGGIDFDGGNDDHIVVPDADILSFTDGSSDTPFTIVSKIYARDNYRFGICSKYSVASPFNGEFSLTLDDSGDLEFQILQSSASDRIRVSSQSAWPENEWHSLAARYDGSEADFGLSLFMDGSEIATNQTGSGTYGGLINRGSDFHIGTILHDYSSGGLWVADGIIAYLYLYRRYLTDDEIASFHQSPYQIFEQSNRAKFFNVAGGTTYQVTASLDALIQKTGMVQTASLDALLQATATAGVDFDALLQAALSTGTNLDGLLQSDFNTTLNIDALIQQALSAGVSIDAMLQAALSTSTALDAIIGGESIATVVLDALLQAAYTRQVSLDALVMAGGSQAVSLDALISIGMSAGVSLDALAWKAMSAGVGLDAIIGDLGITARESIILSARVKDIVLPSRTRNIDV